MISRFFHYIYELMCLSRIFRVVFSYFLMVLAIPNRLSVKSFLVSNEGKKLVAFNSAGEYQFNHIKDLCLSFYGAETVRPVLITSLRQKKGKSKEANELLCRAKGLDEFSYLWLNYLKPRVFIDTAITTYSDCCGHKTTKILYAHGLWALGFSKNYEHIKLINKYNYIFLTGPLQKNALFVAQQEYRAIMPKQIEVGFLKGDRLRAKQKNFDKNMFIRSFGLKNDYTVLFAPTWGGFSVATEWFDDIVSICDGLDINLLIRLHPIALHGKTMWSTGGVSWTDKLENISKKNQNVAACHDKDVNDCLLAADVLITDVSSVSLEFMLLKKPVVSLPSSKYFLLYGKREPMHSLHKKTEIPNIEELRLTLLQLSRGYKYESCLKVEDIVYNPDRSLGIMRSFIDDLIRCDENNFSQ